MSWKISKIEIKNFKFFKEPFVLDTKKMQRSISQLGILKTLETDSLLQKILHI